MNKQNSVRIDLELIHPYLKFKLNKLLQKCNEQGIYLIITEGYRTKEYQDELYARGRTKAGTIVTNARGCDYQSQHQWGVAFDIAINEKGNEYNMAYIRKVATIAKAKPIKLGWGGDWSDFQDNPHFYLTKWGTTPRLLKLLYRNFDKFKTTWYRKVNKTEGLYIWDKSHKNKIKKLPYQTQVKVLWRHLRWSRIEYDGTVGYMRSKFLKK